MRYVALTFGLLAAALQARPVTPALAGQGPNGQSVPINFTIVPGNQHPPKRYFSYVMAPGQSLKDTVAVVNPGATSLTVRFGTSDAVTRPQGGGITFSDSRSQHGIGRWLHIDQSTVTTLPNHVLLVGLTLAVPRSTPPGEYEGTINATNVQPVHVKFGKNTINVHGVVRDIVLLRVAGRARAGLKVAKVGVVHANAGTGLAITLHNTGTVMDRSIAADITFTGAIPRRPVTLRLSVNQITGGGSTITAFAFGHTVPPGAYKVTIQLTYLAQLSQTAPLSSLSSTWSGHVTVPAGASR